MSKAERKVSIVTVVYNAAGTLARTLESVRAQEGAQVEHWVIDGGSNDGSVEVVVRYADRLAGWISEPDEGISDAFNKGLSRAGGDYIMFLNADDALPHPRAVADMLAVAHAHDYPDVVYGDCDLFDPRTGEFAYRVVVPYDRRQFLRGATLPHPGMLMSRRYFDAYGNFDKSFRVGMDFELFVRGIPEVGALHSGGVAAHVLMGGVSASNRKLVVEETIRALKKNGRISALGETRMRATYASRALARRALEMAGLYRVFDAVRRTGR